MENEDNEYDPDLELDQQKLNTAWKEIQELFEQFIEHKSSHDIYLERLKRECVLN